MVIIASAFWLLVLGLFFWSLYSAIQMYQREVAAAEPGGFDQIEDEPADEPAPFILNVQVPDFLEFLRRVRQAAESRHA
jgi:hypothetical protein